MTQTLPQFTRWTAIVLLMVSFGGCSGTEVEKPAPNPTGLSSQALFDKLILFQREIDFTASEYYGGISFNGYDAYLGNLVIYVVGKQNVQETRNALVEVFGQEGSDISIQVWNSESTIANEETKNDFGRTLAGEGVIGVDYDERIDRLVVDLDNVDVITKYESLILSELGLPREAFSLIVMLPAETGV